MTTASPPPSPVRFATGRGDDWLAELHPAYFGMVMATGIVAIASGLLGLRLIASTLLWLNTVFFLTLCGLFIARLIRHGDRVVADLMNHGRCVGFFTMVAAPCILGTQMLIIAGKKEIAAGLWILGIVLWVGLSYSIFTILTVKPVKPTLPEGINGGWLLAVVASQSIAVLGTQLAVPMGWTHGAVLFFCLAIWLGSGMFYMWIISLIFYRYTFFTLSPDDLSPPYWINMGAVAISTLGGTMLIANAPDSALITVLLPFLKGVTLLFWATASWWIPMLFILGIWRHGYKRFPLRYDPLYWGAVFPLGMYTACTIRLSRVMPNAEFLIAIPHVFIYIAQAAWLATFVGLLQVLFAGLRHRALARP